QCVFFFSSRRRHTRFSRDWSSDVCSSDLNAARVRELGQHKLNSYLSTCLRICRMTKASAQRPPMATAIWYASAVDSGGRIPPSRSEERRVGKECRARWPTYYYTG